MPAAAGTPTPDSYWVEPGRLLAGAYPHEAAPFRKAGVTAFLDLTEGEFGIPDRTCPSRETMARILDRIDELLQAGEVVYVHCYAGIGRTGTVVGCWLVRRGMSGPDALAAVERRRGAPPETPEQQRLVLEWR
ncbi:MAG TPA: dual specificity protein phosphatase family protein [Gaiellaceae bacterium]|nr:dual specificity protein phosphatase family protein [Gaiellaceae bacterium]